MKDASSHGGFLQASASRILAYVAAGVVSCVQALQPVAAAPSTPAFELRPITTKRFDEPVHVVSAEGETNRLYVAERAGRIRIVENGQILRSDLIDIGELIGTKKDHSLLGLALAPDFRTSRLVYLSYTDRQRDMVIARFKANPKGTVEDDEIEVVLKIVQPYPNSLAGELQFGPDGYLYIGVGDGGNAGDPDGYGQNMRAMLGKILRIDVAGPAEYRTPPDNPFRLDKESLSEIWALGFHNPWRFSFDKESGKLFVADDGQIAREEVNLVEKGKNYGWNVYEGSSCLKPPCKPGSFQTPITEYGREDGTGAVGGYVYRGSALPQLKGTYIFGDTRSGRIWGLTEVEGKWERSELAKISDTITSFGQDGSGELYITVQQGTVYKLVPPQARPADAVTEAP